MHMEGITSQSHQLCDMAVVVFLLTMTFEFYPIAFTFESHLDIVRLTADEQLPNSMLSDLTCQTCWDTCTDTETNATQHIPGLAVASVLKHRSKGPKTIWRRYHIRIPRAIYVHLDQYPDTRVNNWTPVAISSHPSQYLDTWANTQTSGLITGHLVQYPDT